MDGHQHLLELTKSYLQESVAPHATAIDSDSDALKNALMGMGELGLLALRVPSRWGGSEVSEQTFHTFQELVARYSGALAFLQTQHQSAAAMLVQSQNEVLKREYLPHLGNSIIVSPWTNDFNSGLGRLIWWFGVPTLP
jgi:alkylation response protein AidB-like acyl-CoA dehydrogenase